jgi:integrase
VTVPLLLPTTHGKPLRQAVFAATAWHPALRAAGVTPSRSDGVHALRHFYASALLDEGESVRAVAEWLGHANPAFTLRVYAHLMPDSPHRARKALDRLLADDESPDDGPEAPDGPETAQA